MPKDFCTATGLPCHSIENSIFSRRVSREGFGSELQREAKWLANESDFLPSKTNLLTSLRCAPILFLITVTYFQYRFLSWFEADLVDDR